MANSELRELMGEIATVQSIEDDINTLNTQIINIIKNMQNGINTTEEMKLFEQSFEEVKLKYTKSEPRRDRYDDESRWHFSASNSDSKLQTMIEFEIYCKQLIANYRDVIIVMNDQSRICQARILNLSYVYTSIQKYPNRDTVEFSNHESNLTSDILDVFDEDEEYYYGICGGIVVIIPKTSCQILDIPVLTSIGSFILNDNIIKRILIESLKADGPKKSTFLLFEYQTCKEIDKTKLNSLHEHEPIYDYDDTRFQSLPECDSCSVASNRSYDLKAELLFRLPNSYSSQVFRTKKVYSSHNMYHIERLTVIRSFANIIFDNFISLLLLGNSFQRKGVFQNFKYSFAKTEAEEIELYKDIDAALHESRDEKFRHMKLIDLFIPEIKFLLRMNHLFEIEKRISSFKIEKRNSEQWHRYCETNGITTDTNPGVYLNYLCRTVLRNVVSAEAYTNLLASSATMMVLLLEKLSNSELYFDFNKYLSMQIDDVIRRTIENRKKEGGTRIRKIRSKKHQQNKSSKRLNKRSKRY